MTLQYLDQGKSRLGSDAALAGVDLRCLTLGCGACCRPHVSFSPGSAPDACIGWAILACHVLRFRESPVAQGLVGVHLITWSLDLHMFAHQVATGVCNNPLARMACLSLRWLFQTMLFFPVVLSGALP
jgi:hypothetical protein